jgi:hypothetical protein
MAAKKDHIILAILLVPVALAAVEVRDITPFSAEIIWDGAQQAELKYYLGSRLIDSINVTGNYTLTGLMASSEYRVRLDEGVLGESVFSTPSSRISIGPGFETRIEGKRFFPIMQWLQAKSRISYQSSLGINTFMGQGNGESAGDYLDECQANGAYGIVGFDDAEKEHPALFGWMWVDEPDISESGRARKMPAEVLAEYKRIRSQDQSHPFVMTLTASFFSRFPARDWMNGSKRYYYDYMNTADIIGFDYYMIYGWCKPEWIAEISDSQDEFLQYGNKTTFQWIEAARTSSKWCDITARKPDDGPYPEEIRNEVWQAIIHGAKAIGYFTHSWECPGYTQWCLSAAQEAELRRTNRQITELTDAILADEIARVYGEIDLMRTVSNGTSYIFAVNKERMAKTHTFDAPGSIVEVYDENRTIPVVGGSFTDSFGSLGVHIYILRAGRCTAADKDFNNIISAAEMNDYVREWHVGTYGLADLMEVLRGWKGGCK